MTQYNSVIVNLSNSQLNKLKLTIKNETEVALRLSSNMTGNSNDDTKNWFTINEKMCCNH